MVNNMLTCIQLCPPVQWTLIIQLLPVSLLFLLLWPNFLFNFFYIIYLFFFEEYISEAYKVLIP